MAEPETITTDSNWPDGAKPLHIAPLGHNRFRPELVIVFDPGLRRAEYPTDGDSSAGVYLRLDQRTVGKNRSIQGVQLYE